MRARETVTHTLLRRVNTGDREALNELLERSLPHVYDYVRRELKTDLHRKVETGDMVHEAVLEFLTHSPDFVVSSERHFRALLCRIARNAMGNHYQWFTAMRRDMARELGEHTVLDLDPVDAAAPRPSGALQEQEQEAWLQLALEYLEDDERVVLVLREFKEMTFGAIGEKLGVSEEAAKKRYQRAVPRLASIVQRLSHGRIQDLLDVG